MTTKLRLGALAIILLLPLVTWAAFDDVQLNSGTTLKVSSTISLTVVNGVLEQLAVDSGNLQITLSAGSSVDLTSTDRTTFTYDVSQVSAVFECGTSSSVLTLSLGQGLSTETVVVTPTGSTCSTGGGGAGAGGTTTTTTTSTTDTTTTETTTTETTTTSDGGGVSAAPAPVSTETTATAVPSPYGEAPFAAAESAEPVAPSTPQPSPVAVSVSPVFSGGLSRGLSSPDVKRLQQLLNSDPDTQVAASGVGSAGSETEYFGSLTEAAVQKFQLKYGVVSSASDPGYGYVGPKTRAKLQEVFAGGVPAEPAAPSVAQPSPVAVSVSPVFSGGLSRGLSSPDVKRLQQLLNSDPDTQVAASGVGSAGSETEYFGSLTEAAVQKFQLKYGVVSSASDPGYGYVGPKTRAMLQQVFSQ